MRPLNQRNALRAKMVRPDGCHPELTRRAPRRLARAPYALKRVFERHGFCVVFREPFFGGILACEDLQVIALANQLAGVDINPNCGRGSMHAA
jgi:hypothetical protein